MSFEGRLEPLDIGFALVCLLCQRFFGSDLFKDRSPLAFVLHFLCLLCRRFFGSDLLKGRSPLAMVLHFLCLLCRRFFWFGPFERSKPLSVRFDKYAKFADSAYFANLLFYAACRCWPKLAIWAA